MYDFEILHITELIEKENILSTFKLEILLSIINETKTIRSLKWTAKYYILFKQELHSKLKL